VAEELAAAAVAGPDGRPGPPDAAAEVGPAEAAAAGAPAVRSAEPDAAAVAQPGVGAPIALLAEQVSEALPRASVGATA
jgi:hypothetical protein